MNQIIAPPTLYMHDAVGGLGDNHLLGGVILAKSPLKTIFESQK